MEIPHLEILGFIGSLCVATFAAWTAAILARRTRMVERDLDITTDQLQSLQRSVADVPERQRVVAPVAPPTPTFVPKYTELNVVPLAQQLSAARWTDQSSSAGMIVRETAERLRQQSPAAVQEMLQPRLHLANNDATTLAGQQAARLMDWLQADGRPASSSTHRGGTI